MKKLIAIALLSLTLFACEKSKDDLEKEVLASMQQHKTIKETGAHVTSLILAKESGNVYRGIATIDGENLGVKVVSDGNSFTWEIEK